MMPTRPVMEKIHEANDLLIKAKYILIQAEAMALTIEEKTCIDAVRKRVQEGIKEILRNFFPVTEFDVQAWLKRRRSTDIEHDQRMQKILDDSAERQAESETCDHDCVDCDSREVVGDEEHCLQGEEMNNGNEFSSI